ncbi:hypothetical protein FE257_004460 [Aspergillus nanangensis]|uniref:Protein kinase domain-containing protein n=1 Tax=Aspergillus nanangensis TaxID=2582783 RepID=A0AAD4GYE8_ASPNN|nr:hypothetical protein FE257_004460 [Aspergillus nanangensis]
MNDDLDASRPNWGAQGPAGSTSLTLNATRPQWDHPNGAFQTPDLSSIAHKQTQDDQQRVVHDAGSQGSRPADFLKLVGLMERLAETTDQIPDNLIVDVPFSLLAGTKTLGRGLSFEVILVRVGKQPMENMRLRSEFVVYKKLRGLTDKLDVIEKGELLRAALLEVRILTHQPLQDHPNIIRLLQLIWEPDPDLLDHAWPVIVLEYAENGTLADFQEDHRDAGFALKKQLCRDVGNGLLALHASDIVHGDLKSENVLVCNTSSGGVVAKLADFGCAIADLDPSDTLKLAAFTLPWNAPECHDNLPRDLLKYTDVYSYGLLVWRVVSNGINPFRSIDALATLDKNSLHREVEKLKREDRLLSLAGSTLRHPFCDSDVDTTLIWRTMQLTLRLDALTRDLPSAVALLGNPTQELNYGAHPLMPFEYESVKISLPLPGMAPMCLQLSIIRELVAISANPGDIGANACAKLFQLYLARLEWPGARENAARWLVDVIKRQGRPQIALYLHGISEYLDQPVPSQIDLLGILRAYAADGCNLALLQLEKHYPSKYSAMKEHYIRSGGLMSRHQKHSIFDWVNVQNLAEWFDKFSLSQGDQGINVAEMEVSDSGDLLIHAAARHGSLEVVETLLALGVNIDTVNNDGESAILQAYRAGHFQMGELLVRRGADVALVAKNGETPLHWAVAFDKAQVHAAVDLLISHGAEACLYSAVDIGNSSAVKYMQLHGTPLHYAILARNEAAAHALLSHGADPFFGSEVEAADKHRVYTPFLGAVFDLQPNTVRTMLESPESMQAAKVYLETRRGGVLLPLIQRAAYGHMLEWFSLGRQYVPSFIETFDLIRSFESKHRIVEDPNPTFSMLHAAIVYGQPIEIIEHLLKIGYDKEIEFVSNLRSHTPLQAAIYLNRRDTFLLLLKNGANIHRTLQLPQGISYLHYCAIVGVEGIFFAQELVSRGAVPKPIDDIPANKIITATSSPPALMAVWVGNFELATWLLKFQPMPPELPVVYLTLRTARMPVSRLHYLLESPERLSTASLNDDKDMQRNCFHSISSCKGGEELESIVNFRYLVRQAKARGQTHLINQVDKLGMPPLTGAAILGRLELVRELLLAGADPNLGVVTSANAGKLGLGRLRRAPSQVLDNQDGVTLTMKDARRLEEDFNSIIILCRQFGSTEPSILGGVTKMHFSQMFDGDFKGALNFAKTSFSSSYKRYQAETAYRSRFSSAATADATHPNAGAQGGNSRDAAVTGGKSLKEQFKEGTGFAKWFFRPAPPIKPGERAPIPPQDHPLSPGSGSQGPQIPGPQLRNQPPNLPPRQAPSPISGPSWQATQSAHNTPGTLPVNNRAQQTIPSAQNYQYHINILSGPILGMLSQPWPDSTTLLHTVQACFDRHFLQIGDNALSIEADQREGSPLGSLSVLELENGINQMLRGQLLATMLIRDGLIKAVVSRADIPRPGIEQIRTFKSNGWMGWRDLEDREAEILVAKFEEGMEVRD